MEKENIKVKAAEVGRRCHQPSAAKQLFTDVWVLHFTDSLRNTCYHFSGELVTTADIPVTLLTGMKLIFHHSG